MKPLADAEIPKVVALGRQIAERMRAAGQEVPAPQPGSAGEGSRRWAAAQQKVDAEKK